MFRNRRRTRIARVAAAGAAALLAVGIAACSSSSSPSGGSTSSASASSTARRSAGGTARVALAPGVTLSYIWPYTPLASANEYNAEQFQMLMYRPLYMFGNNGNSVAVNYPLSLANAPSYSADGKTVTITMKGWKWSNGEAVDASDVVFWLNMMKAEPDNYYGYVPGLLPDNLASYSATEPGHRGPAPEVAGLEHLVHLQPARRDHPDAGGLGRHRGRRHGGQRRLRHRHRRRQVGQVHRGLQVPVRAGGEREDLRDQPRLGAWWTARGSCRRFSTSSSGPVTSFVPNAAYSGSPKPTAGRVHVLRVHR